MQSDVTPLGSYVGFDSITNQIERKLLKRGFQFNIICVGTIFLKLRIDVCVGQTGLGKSTLINTIFAAHLIDSKGRLTVNEPVRQTTEIQAVSHGTPSPEVVLLTVVIEEKGVRLRLNIVDTPGYGDQINNDRWYASRVNPVPDA